MIQMLLWALVAYLGYCCVLFMMQRYILFPRMWVVAPHDAATKVSSLERVWLDTESGQVEAWYIPPERGGPAEPAPAVLFAHGNGELIDYWPEELSGFGQLGMGLLLVEYPGYGRSPGAPSEKSITEAFTAAFDYLAARKDVDASRIVLFGRSLGGGAACSLAARRPAAALVLQSTFTSIRSFASHYLAPGFLVRDPFDNLQVVATYGGPVLVMHGTRDTLIPYEHGLALYRAAQRGELVTYECSHNDCPPAWERFWRDVEEFLRKNGILDGRM